MVKTLSSRKISLTTIVIMVITVVTMTISSTVFSTTTTAPVAFGQRAAIDSEQSVTITSNGIGQNNDNAASAHTNTSSLRVTQSPENGLNVECEGDLLCEILDNNTLVATTTTTTNTGENTTNMTITSALDALNQSLAQSLNQSSILPLPFGDNDFNNMLNDDFGIFNEQEDLDSKIDEWVERLLNGTLGDLPSPLQTSPDLLPVSV